MTAFEDLDEDPGDEALDELGATLSEEPQLEPEESTTDESDYDPMEDPAFPSAKKRTQHSIYCLPETWDAVDGSDGLLFESEVQLRRDGVDPHKRELHEALLRAAIAEIDAEDIADELQTLRDERTGGPLL